MEEVLSSSFAPSHGVFTALRLSLSTWFPGRALLLCLYPHRCDLPGPEPLWQTASLPSPPFPPADPASTPSSFPRSLLQKGIHGTQTEPPMCWGVCVVVTGGGDTWSLPGSEAAPEAPSGAGSPLSLPPHGEGPGPTRDPGWRDSQGPAWDMPDATVEQDALPGSPRLGVGPPGRGSQEKEGCVEWALKKARGSTGVSGA